VIVDGLYTITVFGPTDGSRIAPLSLSVLPDTAFPHNAFYSELSAGSHNTPCAAGIPLFVRLDDVMYLGFITEKGLGEVDVLATEEPAGSYVGERGWAEGFGSSVALVDGYQVASDPGPDPHYTLRFFEEDVDSVLVPGQQTSRAFFG